MHYIYYLLIPVFVLHGIGLLIIMEVWARNKRWKMKHFPFFLFIALTWEITIPIMWLITIYRARKYELKGD